MKEDRGGPSELHQERVGTLETLASLTGHVQNFHALPGGEVPDVLRLRPTNASLFVGDAKATETPGNNETLGRLDRYARYLGTWVRDGQLGVLALAVSEVDSYAWLRVLRDLSLRPSGGMRLRGRLDLLDTGTAIVWQSFDSPSTLVTAAIRRSGESERRLPAHLVASWGE